MKLSRLTAAGGLFVCLAALLPAALSAQPLSAGISAPLVPSMPQQSSENEEIPDRSQWKEIEDKRTLYSSAYTAPGGLMIMRYSKRPLNYYNDNGELVPVDASMKPSAGGWCAADQPYPVYFMMMEAHLSRSTRGRGIRSLSIRIAGSTDKA